MVGPVYHVGSREQTPFVHPEEISLVLVVTGEDIQTVAAHHRSRVGAEASLNDRVLSAASEQFEHDICISASKDSVTLGSEVQLVLCARTASRRNDVCSWYRLLYMINYCIMQETASTIFLSHQFTNEQRNILRFKTQFGKHTGIYKVNTLRPVLLTIVGTTLMKKNTLDYAYLLGLFGKIYDCSIWIIIVFFAEILQPVWRAGNVSLRLVLVEEVYAGATNRNVDDTNLNAVR